VLRSVVEPAGAVVVEADAMQLDWPRLLGDGPWALVANLPYNIATPLVLDVLEAVPVVERMLVLVQLEVAERLAAGPGTKAYGIPSVKRAWWADAAIAGKVGPSVFIPQPRVESALVDLRRHAPAGSEAERAVVFDLVETGFNQRRKMLRRSLEAKVGPGDLEAADIRPEARAEELTLADWLRLAAVLS
jgi:16S rRNA (adenine1518-N6/adenine1519-N6)-dimethyltransferase